MADTSILAQSQGDRDLDDGVLDQPAKDRKRLRALDTKGGTTMATTRTKAKAEKQAKRTRKAHTVLYTSETPKGLWSVGAQVKYLGGSRVRNTWLKKGAVGRVFGYRPGKKGGGLYAVRFEGGATLLSAKRVVKVARG